MSELIKREDAIKAVEMFFKDAYIEDADVHCADMEYEINHIPAASQWHRVEVELPKYGQDVLAARLYGADSDGWAYEVIIAHVCEVRGTNYWNATNVTHWMPLPEPPKEDA